MRNDSINYIELPPDIGLGFVKRINFKDRLNILIVQCHLKNDEIGSRNVKQENEDYISFSFRNIISNPSKTNHLVFPCVHVSSSRMEMKVHLPGKVDINNIIIGIKKSYLYELININFEDTILQSILTGDKPFLYEELITANIEDSAKEIFEVSNNDPLSQMLYKVKAEELVYHFIKALLHRNEKEIYPVNNEDIEALYSIRNRIIFDLTSCPPLDILANEAKMSESKMSRLFKQIFGLSIHNYHQKMRITEAAKLIKNKNMSVSEAGFEMGFTNLSHFSRLFERHMGKKPKKYSKTG